MRKTKVNHESIMDKLERNDLPHYGSDGKNPNKDITKDELAIRAEIRNKDIINLKARLKAYGFFTDNLWHIGDVQDRAKEAGVVVSDEAAYAMLNDVLHNEATISELNEEIDRKLEDRYPRYAKFRELSLDEESE